MNVTEVVTRVQRQFGDEASIQITEADVIRWINDAQADIALHSGLLQTRSTTPVIKGLSTYALPPDILTLHSVRFNGVQLKGVSMQEADSSIDNMESTGTPTMFWSYGKNISLWPVPNSALVLLLFYSRRPVPIVTNATPLELPVQYHNRVVEYCLQQAYELDENWAAAGQKQQQFSEGLTRLKADEEFPIREFYPSITSIPEHF